MLPEYFRSLFTTDLNRLRSEIALYSNEENIWKVEGNITNSAGNLCLHLIGNLHHYIGKYIGNTGYIRNRELEFSLKNVSRKELLNMIDDTIRMTNESLDKLDENSLVNDYPAVVFDEKTSIEYVFMHLATHMTYHLGQINYHRRLIDSNIG
jgi:uncharacterized damage-inducible protein DinB